MIVWNGVSSDELGIIVEHYPRIIFPERRIDVYQIPGRNGDRIIDQEIYNNYDQEYRVFLDAKKYGGLEVVMPQIASWLLSGVGYQRLEDSYFPQYYRMAYVKESHEFLTFFNEYGEGTIRFSCAPERFYKIGENVITVLNGQTLTNPTAFRAYPIYYFNSSGVLTLTENGVSRNIQVIGSDNGTIDTKEHTGTINCDYDDLKLGKETTITWTGFGQSIQIKPNWWTI